VHRHTQQHIVHLIISREILSVRICERIYVNWPDLAIPQSTRISSHRVVYHKYRPFLFANKINE
jgi:hypothetical protein